MIIGRKGCRLQECDRNRDNALEELFVQCNVPGNVNTLKRPRLKASEPRRILSGNIGRHRRRDNSSRTNIMDDVRLLSLIETGQIIATLLVAIGVVGEFAGTYIARPIAARVEARRGVEMVRLRAQAAAAELRAAELESLIQPRYLTPEHERAIADSMRPFAGKGMIIASHWIDAEAARLATQIKAALNSAGIGVDSGHLSATTVDKIGGFPEIVTGLFGGGGGFSGPNIHTGIEIWGADQDAVRILAHALTVEGKLSDVVRPESENPFKDQYGKMDLIIFVGSKPVPASK
jgi:hypothetical protein